MDIHTIIKDHRVKNNGVEGEFGHKIESGQGPEIASVSEIPDLFFDQILVEFKLSRIEIMVIMYLYRSVWCRANLYRDHGISQLLSHTEMSKHLAVTMDDIYHALRKLEDFSFIETVRSGQYFVRKYFTKENDENYFQDYDSFEI